MWVTLLLSAMTPYIGDPPRPMCLRHRLARPRAAPPSPRRLRDAPYRAFSLSGIACNRLLVRVSRRKRMFWTRSKGAETRIRLKALERAVTTQSSDPELRLAEALREYESSYYAKVSRARDENAEQAKQIVKQARIFISESRLAYAICCPILNHVMHWPLSRPASENFASGPFRYLDDRFHESCHKRGDSSVVSNSHMCGARDFEQKD